MCTPPHKKTEYRVSESYLIFSQFPTFEAELNNTFVTSSLNMMFLYSPKVLLQDVYIALSELLLEDV